MIALWWTTALALEPGAYALEVEVVTETKLPVIGTKQVHTVSWSLVSLSQDGSGWIQEQRVCSVDVRGGGPARTTLPPAFLAAMPRQRFPVEVGERYRADGGPTALGMESDAALPMSPEDPAVLDSDGDGHPGVTVWVDVPMLGRVDMYVAQRAHTVLDGVVTGTGAEGIAVVKRMEQRTLDASHHLLVANPPIVPVEGASRFRLLPAPSADCEGVSTALGPS
jgi:hypothetical protein